MTKAVHVPAAVIRKPVCVVVARVDGGVVHRQLYVADWLVLSVNENLAAIDDVDAGLEWVLRRARTEMPSRATPKEVVGGAVLLHDDNDVAEGW